jgi:hypothetical protein
MEPLTGGAATLVTYLSICAAVLVALAVLLHRGGISFAFLILAIFTLTQAQEIKKAWPVFGLFIPLLVLSSAAFAPRPRASGSLAGVAALFGATALAALAVVGRLNPNWGSGIAKQWHEYDCGHTELPVDAIAWMKSNHISGRIFNRCEDGGILQQEGYDHGEIFADTGFGKYDEAFIHEVGLVNERPALIPKYIAAYHPDFVVCGNFCFQWPFYLRNAGWRLIFYTPNSSVWTRADIRPDLPTIENGIISAFQVDRYDEGMPSPTLFGRNLIALHSLGLSDLAVDVLLQTENRENAPWVWEAARIMAFDTPALSEAQRQPLERIAEAEPQDHPVLREFRAYSAQAKPANAKQILLSFPEFPLRNAEAQLLAKIELEQNDSSALALARRTDCWDLRNGRHWQYLAEAEERWGSLDMARAAWRKAVFYYPDDDELMKAASEFADKHNDAGLKQTIADSGKVYGVR